MLGPCKIQRYAIVRAASCSTEPILEQLLLALLLGAWTPQRTTRQRRAHNECVDGYWLLISPPTPP